MKNSRYYLFIDDERYPCVDAVIARSSTEAIEIINTYGMPDFISFDHDLGGDDTTRKVLDFIEDQLIDGNIEFPADFSYQVHSQNPVGRDYIIGRMNNLIKQFLCNGE